MSSDKCPVCDSADWMPSTSDSEWYGVPFPCANCEYPIVHNEYGEGDDFEVRLELAYWEEDDRVLAWARDAVTARRERDRAVRLLRMLDRSDARHPDVAAFLDALEGKP